MEQKPDNAYRAALGCVFGSLCADAAGCFAISSSAADSQHNSEATQQLYGLHSDLTLALAYVLSDSPGVLNLPDVFQHYLHLLNAATPSAGSDRAKFPDKAGLVRNLMRVTPISVWAYRMSDMDLERAVRAEVALTEADPVTQDAFVIYCLCIAALIHTLGDRKEAFERTKKVATARGFHKVLEWIHTAEESRNCDDFADETDGVKAGLIWALSLLRAGYNYDKALAMVLKNKTMVANAGVVGGIIGAAVGFGGVPEQLRQKTMDMISARHTFDAEAHPGKTAMRLVNLIFSSASAKLTIVPIGFIERFFKEAFRHTTQAVAKQGAVWGPKFNCALCKRRGLEFWVGRWVCADCCYECCYGAPRPVSDKSTVEVNRRLKEMEEKEKNWNMLEATRKGTEAEADRRIKALRTEVDDLERKKQAELETSWKRKLQFTTEEADAKLVCKKLAAEVQDLEGKKRDFEALLKAKTMEPKRREDSDDTLKHLMDEIRGLEKQRVSAVQVFDEKPSSTGIEADKRKGELENRKRLVGEIAELVRKKCVAENPQLFAEENERKKQDEKAEESRKKLKLEIEQLDLARRKQAELAEKEKTKLDLDLEEAKKKHYHEIKRIEKLTADAEREESEKKQHFACAEAAWKKQILHLEETERHLQQEVEELMRKKTHLQEEEKFKSPCKSPMDEMRERQSSRSLLQFPSADFEDVKSRSMTGSNTPNSGSGEYTPSRLSLSANTMEAMKKEITLVLNSNQLDEAKGHITVAKDSGKLQWTKMHFVFALDCSGSMRGPRWEAVRCGYKRCLNCLAKMESIIVTTFSFDDKANPHINCRTPAEALRNSGKLPFTGKGTNYAKALEWAISCIEKRDAKFKDYMVCVLFLSDGEGGYPEAAVKRLEQMKSTGTRMLFYTIACSTFEDQDMIRMDKELGGEHYRVGDHSSAEAIFLRIIGA